MWLFTRNNRKKGQKLKYNKKKTITKSNFDPSKDTKFIIHGFGGSCKLKILKKLRPALLKAVSIIPIESIQTFGLYLRYIFHFCSKMDFDFFFPCIYQKLKCGFCMKLLLTKFTLYSWFKNFRVWIEKNCRKM